MKKILFVTLVALTSFIARTADIQNFVQKWTADGDNFEMRSIWFDQEMVTDFNKVLVNFHTNEMKKIPADLLPADFSMDKAISFMETKIQDRVEKLKLNAETRLLVVLKNDQVVGGSYYYLDTKNKSIFIAGAAYNEEVLLPGSTANGLAKITAIKAFRSKKFFPTMEKILVFGRANTNSVTELKVFGFKPSTFVHPEFPSPEFCCFEMEMLANE